MSADQSAEEHKYWSKQPVPQFGEKVEEEGPMEVKTVADIQAEPLQIASTFEWWVPDVQDPEDLKLIYQLLSENYVEDDSSLFRFNYSVEFLQWALTPKGYYPEWHVAVRKKSDKQLLAFISGIPLNLMVSGAPKRLCEINFLCIHKKLRSRRLAPILISEVTRRVNLRDMWQAVYTAGVVLPKPFAVAKYYHRSLNPQKLIAIGFSRVPMAYEKFKNPMEALKRNYALPPKTHCKLRPMVPADCSVVAELLTDFLSKFKVYPLFDEAEVVHWLLPRDKVVWAYVIEDKDGKPTDFVSFYSLPSTVIGNTKYPDLCAAYSYYYAAKTVPLQTLMNDALILARDEGFDVFNTLDMLDNEKFIHELKFGPGDGKLQYYMYNWRLKEMAAGDVGLVML